MVPEPLLALTHKQPAGHFNILWYTCQRLNHIAVLSLAIFNFVQTSSLGAMVASKPSGRLRRLALLGGLGLLGSLPLSDVRNVLLHRGTIASWLEQSSADSLATLEDLDFGFECRLLTTGILI